MIVSFLKSINTGMYPDICKRGEDSEQEIYINGVGIQIQNWIKREEVTN